MHINYNYFLQHYEEKLRAGLPVMKQQILLQPRERFSMHLFQDSVMCTAKDKHSSFKRSEAMET
jgi:hypothetical protein